MWKNTILRVSAAEGEKSAPRGGQKRVLYYTSSLASGGAERQLIYTALAAEERGYEVKIVVDYPICHYDYMLEGSGIGVFCTNTTGYSPLKRFYLLSKVIREFRPDVVHSFLGMRNSWAMVLGRFWGVPVRIASIRSPCDTEFTGMRLYRRWAHYIVCNSRLAAEIAREKHSAPHEKLKVIYNAIDYQRFRSAQPLPGLKKEFGLDESVRLGVTVARFTESKNHISLVEALHLLNEEDMLENIHYLFVGKTDDTDLVHKIKKRIASLGLEDKVTFLGVREDIPEVLKTCDFMVLSSLYEGFPNVVLEAMAAGIFVITSPTGGTPELVEDGVNGFLTSGTEPSDISNAIGRYLLTDCAQIDRMRSNATEKAYMFDKNRAFDKLFELYGD